MKSWSASGVLKFSTVFLTLALLATPGRAFDGEFTGGLKDAWLTGKAETVLALNEHLNRYSIGARVVDAEVILTGVVSSEIDKSLATELMKGIADMRSVRNDLLIDPGITQRLDAEKSYSRNSFARWIDDLTTTAFIRSRLVSHTDVHGLDIDVSTNRKVVTLKGQVGSPLESALAEEIARNTRGVTEVHNLISVPENVELTSQ